MYVSMYACVDGNICMHVCLLEPVGDRSRHLTHQLLHFCCEHLRWPTRARWRVRIVHQSLIQTRPDARQRSVAEESGVDVQVLPTSEAFVCNSAVLVRIAMRLRRKQGPDVVDIMRAVQ